MGHSFNPIDANLTDDAEDFESEIRKVSRSAAKCAGLEAAAHFWSPDDRVAPIKQAHGSARVKKISEP